MPTLGDSHPNLVVLDAGAADIHDPEFIVGSSVRTALMQAMSFEEKVYLLSNKLRDMGESARIDPKSVDQSEIVTAEILVDAILIDLATEQAAVLKTHWQPLFFGDTIRKSLEQLRFLADHQFPLVTGDAQQPDVQIAARLLAGVEFLGEYSSRWYESRWFPWGFFRRGPLLRKEILSQQNKLAENLLREPNADQRRLMDEYYAAACRPGRPGAAAAAAGKTFGGPPGAARSLVPIQHQDRCGPHVSRRALVPGLGQSASGRNATRSSARDAQVTERGEPSRVGCGVGRPSVARDRSADPTGAAAVCGGVYRGPRTTGRAHLRESTQAARNRPTTRPDNASNTSRDGPDAGGTHTASGRRDRQTDTDRTCLLARRSRRGMSRCPGSSPRWLS